MVETTYMTSDVLPERYGKVAVVMGGWSAEREVSLMSGQQIFDSLTSAGVDAHAVDAGRDIAAVLSDGGFDRAFLILHGRGGEDGMVQGALELAGIPYTGSGVLASALSMDKWRAKGLVSLKGIATPEAFEVFTLEEAEQAASQIGFPVVIKPTLEGSSIGVAMVNQPQQLEPAFLEARRYGPVLVEKRMLGIEVTAGILGQEALPLVSMKGADEFYDYKAKYIADNTVYQCPVDLPESVATSIQETALDIFRVLGCRGWGRVDFMLDEAGVAHFIECNTAPGMTSHSLVPIAARQAGMDFPTLCLQILSDTLDMEESIA
ncbi:D-alanine--D-alanine ligase [Granulosicoccus antarcticus]|uniref:D-alanine--D-alanine ligase n=1 Tax=Granulosicoccus antarcticus IMCC3135 TaxID=1192854 RepID=A0A2Z2NZM6_9GAMM|nr:D-alanine--D-alanine ligase [Granulosicoccus antarcticus]ASJ75885.1 D-alanine--D-alanine ligase B [Granulosicoccus antarcticus IMCC3135]